MSQQECCDAAAPAHARCVGTGHRSAGDLEPGLFDLDDQIAGEAGLDAERALDPLPRLGHDILVEPLARRVIQRPDRDDSPVVGYLEIAH